MDFVRRENSGNFWRYEGQQCKLNLLLARMKLLDKSKQEVKDLCCEVSMEKKMKRVILVYSKVCSFQLNMHMLPI